MEDNANAQGAGGQHMPGALQAPMRYSNTNSSTMPTNTGNPVELIQASMVAIHDGS